MALQIQSTSSEELEEFELKLKKYRNTRQQLNAAEQAALDLEPKLDVLESEVNSIIDG